MTAKDILLKEINDLQLEHQHVAEKLKARILALRHLDALTQVDERIKASSQSLPYFGMRTWKAMRSYIKQQGHPVSVEQLTKAMIAGGAFHGKSMGRARKHVVVSVKMSKHLDIQGDRVGLSEWFVKGGKYSNLKPEKKK